MIKITERYRLPRGFKEELLRTPVPWGFGALSEVVFYRTYSREKPDGTSETFPETIIRVVEAIGSIRKTFYRVMGVPWNQDYWDRMLQEMARRMLQLKLLPPGRGLWALGSTTVEEKGSMALYNCAYTNVVKLSRDLPWAMDALMLGVGVGFGIPYGYQFQLKKPDPDNVTVYEIPDTREGWCSALEMLLRSYELAGSATVKFDYSRIRPAGAKIRGFGGVASGPEPLAEMLEKVRERLDRYCNDQLDPVHGQHVTLLVADIANLIGKCVVSGNVRRSAEILLGSINDPAFRDLKNADVYPERNDWQTGWSWLSNNSVRLGADEEFLQLDQIADGMIRNGEPGIVNLRNIREFGRYGRPKQDYALGINPCVPGHTRILTRGGYIRIDALVDTPVEVWNGLAWSLVTPRVTGYDQPMVTVYLSDGTALTTTLAHRFHVCSRYGQDAPEVVAAADLLPGTRLWKYRMPVVEEGEPVDPALAYTQGVYAGDGYRVGDAARVWLYGEKRELVPSLALADAPRYYETRVGAALQVETPEKTFVPLAWRYDARLAWLAGLIDTDGSLTRDGSLQISSVKRDFLNEVRLMLTTLGVQAKVRPERSESTRFLPDGRGGLASYRCRATHRLQISAADVVALRDLGLSRYLRRVDIGGVAPQRDARRFVTVERVEEAGTAPVVYCFTEVLNHSGTFEGVVTGQCGEIPLEDKETCNLVEVFPTRHTDENDFLYTLQLATVFAHTVSLLPTHSKMTNEVVMRNHRIGVSLSGIWDWLSHTPVPVVIRRLRDGYKTVEWMMRFLAAEAGVRESVRLTTVKPSGTVSLLAGVSPGANPPHATRYLRRVTLSANSPIVERLLDAGIPVEPKIGDPRSVVATFPVELEGGRTRSVGDVPLDEHAAVVAMLQREWADNAVSNTMVVNERDVRRIAPVLGLYTPVLKSLTIMVNNDESEAYPQAPYEAVSKEKYDKLMRSIKPIDWSGYGGTDGQDTKYCDGEACAIDFSES